MKDDELGKCREKRRLSEEDQAGARISIYRCTVRARNLQDARLGVTNQDSH